MTVGELIHDFVHVGHVGQVDVDIKQKDFVHQFAAFADGFAWDDDSEAVGGVAASRVDAVARADSRDDQRVDAQSGQHCVQVRVLERRGVAFADDFFGRLAIQPRIEFKAAAQRRSEVGISHFVFCTS